MSDISAPRERVTDRMVLLAVSCGLISILLGILIGLFTSPRALPNWAENVLVSMATAVSLKLGDCLSTLVALSSGRSVEKLGTQLANTTPVTEAIAPAADAATGKSDDPVHTIDESKGT